MACHRTLKPYLSTLAASVITHEGRGCNKNLLFEILCNNHTTAYDTNMTVEGGADFLTILLSYKIRRKRGANILIKDHPISCKTIN